MTTQVESSNSKLDVVKWLVVVAILVAATLANQYLEQVSSWIRLAGVVIAVAGAVALALTTSKGRDFLGHLKDSQVELKKIVWPTKQETWQTTLIVLAVVVVMSLFLWGIDSLFGWIVSSIIG